MRQFVFGAIALIWIGILTGIVSPLIMDRLGIFLVVDEKAPPVDVVVTFWVNDKVVGCYKSGRCKKVFLILNNKKSQTWRAISRLKDRSHLKKNVLASGIKESDFFLFFMDDTLKTKPEFICEIMQKNGIRSGLFLVRYYKTRRYRFFLDRCCKKTGLDLFVQPLKDQYISKLDHWWDHTAFANYFLSEYIRMAYYFFNKAFLTNFFINSIGNDS